MRHLIVLLALTLAVSFACGAEEEAASAQSSDEGTRIAIEVGSHGYTPASVTAEAGKPLTMVFERTTDEGCGDVLVIPSQDIRRDLPLNEEVAVTFTPTEAGELRFTCGMDMYDGAIVVQ
ncbi:MAG: cupredoxin domain-containing protein [Deltaproteobacteria bacterium]|nr:cupredoxin domain-containing protein [Deltaproteobacteria bacterium]